VLLHSIVSQRALVLQLKKHENKISFRRLRKRSAIEVKKPTVSSKESIGVEESEQVTTYSISFTVGFAKVVLVNDFNSKNLPIFQIFNESTLINIDGVPQHLEGIGHVSIGIDFYNAKFCCWEPCLETWKPELKVVSNTGGIVVELNSPQNLQFNLTGIMLQRLLQTYSVALHVQDGDINKIRTEMHDLVVKNELGELVVIRDSNTLEILFHLSPGESRPFDNSDLTKINWKGSFPRSSKTISRESSVDICFTGKLGVERYFHIH
jgi:hypothetical protein